MAQTITTLPQPPLKGVDYAEQFDAKARDFLGALPTFSEEINALGEELNTAAEEVEANTTAAAGSAEAAAGSAEEAAASESAAAGSAAEAAGSATEAKTSEDNAKASEEAANLAAEALKAAAGGILPAYDFGVAQPTQEALTLYAATIIWKPNGTWTLDSDTLSASTYVDVDGVTHTAVDIFSDTRVKNAYYTPNAHYRGTAADETEMGAIADPAIDDFCDRHDTSTEWRYDGTEWADTFEPINTTARKVPNEWTNHEWRLTNTPTTTPKVFTWQDNGSGDVAIATPAVAGVVRPDNVTIKVDPRTGVMETAVVMPTFSYDATTQTLTITA
jgi:hypothetical protein